MRPWYDFEITPYPTGHLSDYLSLPLFYIGIGALVVGIIIVGIEEWKNLK